MIHLERGDDLCEDVGDPHGCGRRGLAERRLEDQEEGRAAGVLSWRLSNTPEGRFCLEALDEALALSRPEIFNTDQGSQFTAWEYTSRLEEAGIQVSRDGRGRALDNVFVERLWRSVNTNRSTSKTMSESRTWSRAWRPTSGSTTRSVPISPWAIGLRPRSIEPGLAETERGRPVTNPAQPSGPARWVEQPWRRHSGCREESVSRNDRGRVRGTRVKEERWWRAIHRATSFPRTMRGRSPLRRAARGGSIGSQTENLPGKRNPQQSGRHLVTRADPRRRLVSWKPVCNPARMVREGQQAGS
jgi:transposase InsO family protein